MEGSKSATLRLASQLRQLVGDALTESRPDAAVFFAEKLVSVSAAGNQEDQDLLLLARSYLAQGSLRRALHLLQRHGLHASSSEGRVCTAKIHAALGEWNAVLTVLSEAAPPAETPARLAASWLQLQGDAFYAIDNREAASQSYQAALRRSVTCVEAFEALQKRHLLTAPQERALVASLTFTEDTQWLQVLFQARLKPYISQSEREEVMDKLGALGLAADPCVARIRAEAAYVQARFRDAHDITSAVLEADPLQRDILPTHVCCLVELGKVAELYYLAHTLVHADAKDVLGWFAVACYYYAIQNNDLARRYFTKATSLDEAFAPAWLGFGHTFALADEPDPALAAYRNASRLFAGLHLPLLYLGAQYVQQGNFQLGEQFLREAVAVCPDDPLVYHELGVVYYQNREFKHALTFFEQAISRGQPQAARGSKLLEPSLFNAAHTLRKLGRYTDALAMFERALQLQPHAAATFAGIGLTLHLDGRVADAVVMYHRALGLDAHDTLTQDLLAMALRDHSVLALPPLDMSPIPPPGLDEHAAVGEDDDDGFMALD